MKPFTIDSEFQSLIAALAPDEYDALEKNLLRDGCREPLTVWHTEPPVLLDGHNRHRICQRHGIEYQTVEIELEDRAEAIAWIKRNQLGRRNLSLYTRSAYVIDVEAYDSEQRGKANQAARKGGQAGATFQNSEKLEPVDTTKELAKLAGVSHDTIARVKKIKDKADDETKAKLAAGQTSINQVYTQIKRDEKEAAREARRDENRAKVEAAQTPADIIETDARFATIVIDPPWDWGDEGDADQLGRARPTYVTMSLADLLALPVPDLADVDSHIYLWITNRSLPKGFQLLERWGFRYITAITWAKPSFGMGNYFRGQTEHVLFGVRGSQPLKRKDVGTLFSAPRGPNGHSSKPEQFLELVESCSPGPYLEMFSRCERDGWQAWGEDA